jgi:hypothetical protein
VIKGSDVGKIDVFSVSGSGMAAMSGAMDFDDDE